MAPTYEMFWDCKFCGASKLLGKSHRHCPGCGAAQDADWRYFPAEDEKVAVEDHVFVGVDRSCPACEAPNSAAGGHCVNCGAPMDGSAPVARQDSVAAGAQSGERSPPAKGNSPPPPAQRTEPKRFNKGCLLVAFLAIPILIVTFVGLSVFWTRDVNVQIEGHRWERSVEVETYSSLQEGSWCSSLPGGAYEVARSTRQSGTNEVAVGETCTTVNVDNGDGTFSTSEDCTTDYISEPVYDEWCDYRIDRWAVTRTAELKGDALEPAPSWPTPDVSNCSGLGCTRLGKRDEGYFVDVKDSDGDIHECRYKDVDWANFRVGESRTGKKSIVLGFVACNSLLPHRQDSTPDVEN